MDPEPEATHERYQSARCAGHNAGDQRRDHCRTEVSRRPGTCQVGEGERTRQTARIVDVVLWSAQGRGDQHQEQHDERKRDDKGDPRPQPRRRPDRSHGVTLALAKDALSRPPSNRRTFGSRMRTRATTTTMIVRTTQSAAAAPKKPNVKKVWYT